MTLELLLQIINEKIKHFDWQYPSDIKWSTSYIVQMLNDVLAEYEKRKLELPRCDPSRISHWTKEFLNDSL